VTALLPITLESPATAAVTPEDRHLRWHGHRSLRCLHSRIYERGHPGRKQSDTAGFSAPSAGRRHGTSTRSCRRRCARSAPLSPTARPASTSLAPDDSSGRRGHADRTWHRAGGRGGEDVAETSAFLSFCSAYRAARRVTRAAAGPRAAPDPLPSRKRVTLPHGKQGRGRHRLCVGPGIEGTSRWRQQLASPGGCAWPPASEGWPISSISPARPTMRASGRPTSFSSLPS
jgi:hypothetical protein